MRPAIGRYVELGGQSKRSDGFLVADRLKE